LPVGVAAGRWGWRVFAGQLGVLPAPVVPLVVIFLAVPAALFLAMWLRRFQGGQPRVRNRLSS
jgi:hypothetical protein